MNQAIHQKICPVEKAGMLDNLFRRFIQNPKKILSSHFNGDIIAVDLGCGPGFFTIEIAKRLSNSGKVIAVDVQQGMLDIVKNKIRNQPFESKIILHKADFHSLNLNKKADIILAFYVVHEINRSNLFEELKTILKPDGMLYIVEPRFHITRQVYQEMINVLLAEGFEVVEKPKIVFSRAVILKLKDNTNESHRIY